MNMFLLSPVEEQIVIAWLHSGEVQKFLATDSFSSFHVHFNREPSRVVISANAQANGETMHSGPLCEYKR